MNTLYYGDNLGILRDYIKDESVDLIYLDPPFASNRNYNVLFKDESGKASDAQITAFTDTWHWGHASEEIYAELVTGGRAPERVATVIAALRQMLGTNQMMAYLVMMTVRLVELHRVLKPTGSLYLHCDPTACHYLKILLDSIFGPQHFRNQLIWKRYGAHNDAGQGSKHYGRVHDILLFYSKTGNPFWKQVFTPLDPNYVKETYNRLDPETDKKYTTTPLTGPGGEAKGNPVFEWNGHTRAWRYNRETMERLDKEGRLYYSKTGYVRQKLYLDESKGIPVQDLWNDIASLSGAHAEKLGYPTQKPLALLERIIEASCPVDGVMLDPFCGCGTSVAAAQKLNRTWIGIDITYLAIALNKYRLEDAFPGIKLNVIGEPQDVASAKYLASTDRYQFQWWASSLVKAMPLGGQEGSKQGKKGADKGVDGVITFLDEANGKLKRILVQIKSGHVKSGDIRDLCGAVEREKAAMGVFITLEPPTQPMLIEATSAGFYRSPGFNKNYPRIQILTIEELLPPHRCEVKMPPPWGTFKQAQRENVVSESQSVMGL